MLIAFSYLKFWKYTVFYNFWNKLKVVHIFFKFSKKSSNIFKILVHHESEKNSFARNNKVSNVWILTNLQVRHIFRYTIDKNLLLLYVVPGFMHMVLLLHPRKAFTTELHPIFCCIFWNFLLCDRIVWFVVI